MFKKSLLAAASILALTACGDDNSFEAELSGAKEKPTAVTTSATGSATAEIDGTSVVVEGDFTGLSGPATLAHIHGPADVNASAGVICPLTVPSAAAGTITGTCTLTAEQLQQLRDGLMYINIHTAANPSGEIRGQLL
jgi:hypothetical protein